LQAHNLLRFLWSACSNLKNLLFKVSSHNKDLQKLTAAGLLISLGIIYGDIGTSPLYVFKAIIGEGHAISEVFR
jgi:K+ transporter